MSETNEQLMIPGIDIYLDEFCPFPDVKSPKRTAKKLEELLRENYMYLDLRPEYWNLFGPFWEPNSQAIGDPLKLNTGPAPYYGPAGALLSDILEKDPDSKYNLSKTACRGILRRSIARGKALPPQLKQVLIFQAEIFDEEALAAILPDMNEDDSYGCLTPWDVQSRRIFDGSGTWPALYAGEGGGKGYISEKKELIAFACNQRDELRDLGACSGVLQTHPGMKQQTFIIERETQSAVIPINTQIATRHKQLGEGTGFGIGENGDPSYTLQEAHSHGVFITQTIPSKEQDEQVSKENGNSLTQAEQGDACILTAGFCAGAAPSAGSIGYQEECAPTLKGASSGTNMVPSIICLNDQGGQCMEISENITGTLRAQMHSHPPLVMSGDADSLEADEDITYCIAGNIIDRETHNGGNGFGYQPDISYTLNTCDKHVVYSRQRSDQFQTNEVTSTQSARQYKDSTDLVLDVAGLDCRNSVENGDLCGTLQSKTTGGYSLNNVHPVRTGNLLRRLTVLECERLMGVPDGWTDIEGGSDSARYKALGNSVAIPCVDFIMRGIAYFLSK